MSWDEAMAGLPARRRSPVEGSSLSFLLGAFSGGSDCGAGERHFGLP